MEDNDILWKSILQTEFNINKIESLSKEHGYLVLLVHDRRGFSILHWAVILGLNKLVVYLLNKGVPVDLQVQIKEKPQSIHLAALEGRLKIIDILIKYGSDINAIDNKGCTPLMRAAMCGQNLETKTPDTILFLLSRGANPKLCDNMGFSALHHATFFGNEEAVSLLITIGLDVNKRDNDGFKPLDIALHTKNSYIINELANYTKESKNGNLDQIIKKCSKKTFTDYIDLFLIFFARLFVFVFIITTLFWSYPQYIFNYYPKSKDLYLIHIAILISSTCLWVCWYRVMKKNPGYLQIDSEEYYNILEYKLNLVDKHKMHQIIPDDIFKDAKLCHICRTLQSIRSKHCRFCKRCTEYFDHHCMYLNNCIGKRNRISFLCLIFHMLFVGLMYLILILIIIKRHNWSFNIQDLANIIFSIKLIMISSILTFCSIRRTFNNFKIKDHFKNNNYNYLKKQTFYNNQMKGDFWSNLKDYFTTNILLINRKKNLFNQNNYLYQPLSTTDSFDI